MSPAEADFCAPLGAGSAELLVVEDCLGLVSLVARPPGRGAWGVLLERDGPELTGTEVSKRAEPTVLDPSSEVDRGLSLWLCATGGDAPGEAPLEIWLVGSTSPGPNVLLPPFWMM